MSSHLRNGKDLWFEQQIVAKTAAVAAAARDQQRAKLQPAQHGADELKASAGAIAQNQLNLVPEPLASVKSHKGSEEL
ncbi:hypothetical protein PCANC_16044 [Puccinia coronata f. sp. avenae]|uniref:Uncharacterized protein n=1 Tax=Puccinia coronata f. sp. avenae TaxID=200324 RepID=A0A2N5ULP2_9BASI|nr:hypothetical protein PCANC_16044 [Puccinia coronata f. sp. avenae]